MSSPAPVPRRIDPRAPRFGAAVTAVLLLLDLYTALLGGTVAAVVLLAAICLLFAWGAFAGFAGHPYERVFRLAVRPMLQPARAAEDAGRFVLDQRVGFVLTLVGTVLGAVGLTWGLVVCAALAFVAAGLYAAFGLRLGGRAG